MTPSKKYGDEFRFSQHMLGTHEGLNITGYRACVCIQPAGDKQATLIFAWQVARQLAEWLAEEFATAPKYDRFQIIVAWSKRVRPHQGHVIKVWGHQAEMRQLAASETYQDYALATGYTDIPIPRWKKMSSRLNRPNHALQPTAGALGVPLEFEPCSRPGGG